MKSTPARPLSLLLLCAAAVFALAAPARGRQGGTSPDGIWRSLNQDDVRVEGSLISGLRTRPQVPEGARFVRLDTARLRRGLTRSAARVSTAARTNVFEITLPLPDGAFVRFEVEEASLMEPALAATVPDVKSYRGRAVDDPSMTVRFNQTAEGVFAIVIAPGRTFHIDPFPQRRGDTTTHVTFFRRDATDTEQQFGCQVGEDAEGPEVLNRLAARRGPFTNGQTLRTYRLAVAATGEYTQFHGGTVDRALRAIVTSVTRVNAIYERELAINLILVGGERSIIHTDAANDPYTNGDADQMLNENQRNIDDKIGTANYDIGHVFGVGAGGKATLRSVGQPGLKARGVTGSANPVNDPFDVDYVAHEMGHQFGANHTFNGTTGSCRGRNRNPTTAYEPGSGSTIMAYAGICGAQDLQRNSDPYFHAASIEEIVAYVTGSAASGGHTTAATNNNPPSVSGPDPFIVPKGTPFSLKASGTDPDGDRLTFSWEEFDLGILSPPDDDIGAVRPIFRVFSPAADGVRSFPQMSALLSGSVTAGEALPARNRVMLFRVTARDSRPGGGAVSFAETSVTVNTDAGPFDVRQPAAASVWQPGSTQTVTWDVAGTDLAPIGTLRVNIFLSTDGGRTFNSTPLLADAPNTGSANVTVPNTPTAAARIRVEAVGNSYFDVSPGDFRIGN